MNIRLAASLLAAAGAAGCTSYPGDYYAGTRVDTPVLSGQVTPAAVTPGSAFDVSYSVQSVRAVTGISVAGLPANTVAAGTNAHLTVPYTNGQITRHTLMLHQPAAAGVYPLQLRVTFSDGTTTMQPIGTLTVADIPGVIESVAIEPAGHAIRACPSTTTTTSANLRYTVADPNGAADVTNAVLTIPAFPSTAFYQTVPAVPPVATVTSVTPSGFVVTQPVPIPAPTVIVQPAATAAVQPTAVALSAPTAANAVRQHVVTPISIACGLPAGNWTWQLQASDVDQITGAQRIIGPAPIVYATR
jgi:hypothetical protein